MSLVTVCSLKAPFPFKIRNRCNSSYFSTFFFLPLKYFHQSQLLQIEILAKTEAICALNLNVLSSSQLKTRGSNTFPCKPDVLFFLLPFLFFNYEIGIGKLCSTVAMVID